MDTITHGLIGALSSNTGFGQRAGRIATIAFTAGAVFPDLDVIVSLFGADLSLRHHRGVTHSVIAAPIFAVLIGWIITKLSSYKNFKAAAGMVALGIYSHIFFDLITSYGTVALDPVSDARYGWNLVFILDAFISLPVIAGLLISRRKPEAARKASVAALVFLGFYLLFCLYARELNSREVMDFARGRSLSVVKSEVYPRPLAPYFWMGIVETDGAFYRVRLAGGNIESIEEIPKPEANRFIELAKGLDAAALYFWFADFPIASHRVEGERHVVEFRDLRFGVVSGRTHLPFRAEFDAAGELEGIYLNGRKVPNRN
ncbi:MAG: metal-dependent hydrolase [Deltaproteobacteria bacterium]